MLKPIKGLIHTITSDNGKEFSFHEEVAKWSGNLNSYSEFNNSEIK